MFDISPVCLTVWTYTVLTVFSIGKATERLTIVDIGKSQLRLTR